MTLSFTLDGLSFSWDVERGAWATSDSLAEEVLNQVMTQWAELFPGYDPLPPLSFMTYLADHRELSDVVIKDLPRGREDRIY